jgi:dihydrofolate synthase/folylpolyglutamate synthase
VITSATSPEAVAVIQRKAAELNAPFVVSSGKLPHEFAEIELPLIGEHQRTNAALALETVSVLQGVLPVTPDAIRRGLESVSWPGRLQFATIHGRDVLLDGAHNPDGARSLAAALRTRFGSREFSLVLGIYKDKAWTEMCEALVPLAARTFLVPLPNERSADPSVVRAFCMERWPDARVDAAESVRQGLSEAMRGSFTVVAGSLHLVGEVMEILQIGPQFASERELNEWDASNSSR